MSLHLPARRIAATASQAAASRPCLHLQYLLPQTQRRAFNWGLSPKVVQNTVDKVKKDSAMERQKRLMRQSLDRTRGSSIFEDELEVQDDPGHPSDEISKTSPHDMYKPSTVKEHMQRALDPDPRWRVRFLKKKVRQMVRDADKPLTKAQRIKLTEKEHTSMSDVLPTSTKRLMFLSRQIVGKTVDDAITQMRFSKKKMAREVKWQLELARDAAIAERGMGLGVADGKVFDKPRQIQTKDGKWMEVKDPTNLYVDQSWVGKRMWIGQRIHFMARGRMTMMWKPSASISIVLKEEKTRLRQHDDRVEKQIKKAPWVHLPNRPVTAQRQYYSW
ncbi:ribosomal protein L22 [Annulohypoxylon maeteangense]|uniref:ribosomal protein L22 n=1 Tax=Annulohypoxylon maeteangense TaxID=1927788 RepID=UPI002008A1E9|nr:ribosomal protein L22 [Annulohypoxylon maeteangense]KAI0880685.1 ribosomal protein L22 [Annulohypoxylon maeteangense]